MTVTIEWSDDLSVGNDLIDEQHKMLIDHLDNLNQAVQKNLGPTRITEVLGFLIEYTDFHFTAEEKAMKGHSYPGLDEHILKHETYKKSLFELEQDYKEEGATNPLAESLDNFLFHWLVEHIKGTDQGFGNFLKKNNIEIKKDQA